MNSLLDKYFKFKEQGSYFVFFRISVMGVKWEQLNSRGGLRLKEMIDLSILYQLRVLPINRE